MSTLLSKFSLKGALGTLSPLSARKSPNLAAFLGFLFGGIGIGLYFWSFIDALIPLAIVLALTFAVDQLAAVDAIVGLLTGAIVAALYGYLRASDSNRRLAETEAATAR